MSGDGSQAVVIVKDSTGFSNVQSSLRTTGLEDANQRNNQFLATLNLWSLPEEPCSPTVLTVVSFQLTYIWRLLSASIYISFHLTLSTSNRSYFLNYFCIFAEHLLCNKNEYNIMAILLGIKVLKLSFVWE